MNEQIVNRLVREARDLETPKSGYAAPKMFAVGQTVELIQGAQNKVLDYPGSWGVYA